MAGDDTIIALSTPRAVSAIHIIRISGPQSREFLTKHTGVQNPEPRKIFTGTYFSGNKSIDQIMAFFMAAPKSYTGEDMAEIHCHGSLLIIDEILKTAVDFGLRPAQPGEFTQRAFLNGKISIEQAEAVDALVKASDSYLKNNALNILEQKTSLKFSEIKDQILDLVSEMETAIEFPEADTDQEDEKSRLFTIYLKRIDNLINYFQIIIDNYNRGRKREAGFNVVLSGIPNAGKSTLLNLLLRENRSIVSPQQGTTRDYIQEKCFIGAFPVNLTDTAGIRYTKDDIEQEGVQRAMELVKSADLLVFLAVSENCCSAIEEIRSENPDLPFLVYINKADTLSKKEQTSITSALKNTGISSPSPVSLTQDGPAARKQIETDIESHLQKYSMDKSDEPAILNERQKHLSHEILRGLDKIKNLLVHQEPEEIIVEELGTLDRCFDEMNLAFSHDEVFDRVFSRFCLGK